MLYNFIEESRRTILKHLRNGDIGIGSLMRLQKQSRVNSGKGIIPSLEDDLKLRFRGQIRRGIREAKKRGEHPIYTVKSREASMMPSKKYFGYKYEEPNVIFDHEYNISKRDRPFVIRQRLTGNPIVDISTEKDSGPAVPKTYRGAYSAIKRKWSDSTNPKVQRKIKRRGLINDVDTINHETNELVQQYKLIERLRRKGLNDDQIEAVLKRRHRLQDILGGGKHNPGVLTKDRKWYDEYKFLHGHEGFTSDPVTRSSIERFFDRNLY